jgi:hypothetical protein
MTTVDVRPGDTHPTSASIAACTMTTRFLMSLCRTRNTPLGDIFHNSFGLINVRHFMAERLSHRLADKPLSERLRSPFNDGDSCIND